MIRYVYTTFTNYDEILRDLEEKLKLGFEPEFYFLFLTESTWKLYKKILKFLKSKFPNCKMSGCMVEGYVTREGIWTRGLALLFFEKGVDVFWAKGKTAEETFAKLKESMKNWTSAITIFPLFKFKSGIDLINFVVSNNTVWRFRYWKARDRESKIRVLERYSRVLEERYVFPANKALRVFEGEKPVVGINLLPLEAGYETPLIFANYEVLERSAVAVCLKGKTNVNFHDVFPERGKSFEETAEIIKNHFTNVREVEVTKRGVAVGDVNGIPAVEFLKRVRHVRVYDEKEVLNMLERGKLRTVSPYALAFISEETYGSSLLGILPYPLLTYPSLFELDKFYDRAFFVGERFEGGVKAFKGLFESKRFEDSFDFFVIDGNVIPMFAGRCAEIKKFADEFCSEYFGIASSMPSIKTKNLHRRHFSEIEDGLCLNGTGTSVMVELRC